MAIYRMVAEMKLQKAALIAIKMHSSGWGCMANKRWGRNAYGRGVQ